jgi:hypothetical protein
MATAGRSADLERYTHAEAYYYLGYSVIPLWGSTRPDAAKLPAVAWKLYQSKRATHRQLHQWFVDQGYPGVGIVTGSVSRLLVLDFDSADLKAEFGTHFPEWFKTHTVRTRRGWHLYYWLPSGTTFQTRRLDGLDAMGEGGYVVAPPTVVDGHTYSIERGGLPRQLTEADLCALEAFLNTYSTASETSDSILICNTPEVSSQACHEIQSTTDAPFALGAEPLTRRTLELLYLGFLKQHHRNRALFEAACLARDNGWRYATDVAAVLVPLHIAQQPKGQHRVEKPEQRQREALRTIQSAFSRPPRRKRQPTIEGYSNSAREVLVQRGMTYALRVLEGLRLVGIKPGQTITIKEARLLLKGRVGRDSIDRAFAALGTSGEPLFSPASPPPDPHPSYAAIKPKQTNKKNAFVRGQKPGKTPGRPAKQFILPTNDDLCRKLDVTPTGSDPLTLKQLSSAKATRQAMHRALIQRRPGLYARGWLADRLGICVRTLHSYNCACQLSVTPQYLQEPLHWGNLDQRLSAYRDEMPAGTLISDATGKRYPPVRALAAKLLAQGKALKLLHQTTNYYAVQGVPQPLIHPQQAAFDAKRWQEEAWRVQYRQQREAERQAEQKTTQGGQGQAIQPPLPALAAAQPPTYIEPPASKLHRPRKRRYTRAFKQPDLEALAQRIYNLVNAMTQEQAHKISLASARKWVDVYGVGVVKHGLERLGRKGNITKPAGFIATVMRCKAKFG